MPAAVVPAEHPLREAACDEEAEDALDVSNSGGIFLFFVRVTDIGGHFGEESCRRKLTFIADDDHLTATRDGTKGVHRLYLTGLIHHEQIKGKLARRQELGDGKRTHH